MSVQDVVSCHFLYSFSHCFMHRDFLGVKRFLASKDQCICVEHAMPTIGTMWCDVMVCVCVWVWTEHRCKLINLLNMSFMFCFHCDINMMSLTHTILQNHFPFSFSSSLFSKWIETAPKKCLCLCECRRSCDAMRCVWYICMWVYRIVKLIRLFE